MRVAFHAPLSKQMRVFHPLFWKRSVVEVVAVKGQGTSDLSQGEGQTERMADGGGKNTPHTSYTGNVVVWVAD